MNIKIPTEPIGSIPRPRALIDEIARVGDGTDPSLEPFYREALRDTLQSFEDTGSPVITDGEQRKYHNFWTYSVHGLANTAPDGFSIPFAAGHVRRMPRLTAGPFRYVRYADRFLDEAHEPHASARQTGGDLARPRSASCIRNTAFRVTRAKHFIEDLLSRAHHRGAALPRQRRTRRADRLHRGAIRGQGRPERRIAREFHRSEQPRARRACRLPSAAASACTPAREAIATPPTAPTRLTPGCCRACSSSTCATFTCRCRARKIARPCSKRFARTCAPTIRCSSASPRPSTRGSKPRKRCATASSRRRNTFRSRSSAPPTIADSPLSATTCRRRAKSPLPRFARAWKARRSPEQVLNQPRGH